MLLMLRITKSSHSSRRAPAQSSADTLLDAASYASRWLLSSGPGG